MVYGSYYDLKMPFWFKCHNILCKNIYLPRDDGISIYCANDIVYIMVKQLSSLFKC